MRQTGDAGLKKDVSTLVIDHFNLKSLVESLPLFSTYIPSSLSQTLSTH